jgi:hypothetical protein
LKRRTPRGIWALRGVTAAVATIVIVVVASVAYSGFEDFQGVRSELASGSHVPVSASYDQATGTETVSLNITVPNRGLYPLNVTVTCSSASSDVSCQRAQAFVPAGGQQVLHFSLSVRDVPQFLSSQDHSISGTVFIGLVPFATLSVGVNFTSFVQVPRGA